jgi:hypothetical protein
LRMVDDGDEGDTFQDIANHRRQDIGAHDLTPRSGAARTAVPRRRYAFLCGRTLNTNVWRVLS